MKTIILALTLAAIGILIMIQQGDHDMLINERPALAVACLLAIIGSIVVMLADTFEVTLKGSAS